MSKAEDSTAGKIAAPTEIVSLAIEELKRTLLIDPSKFRSTLVWRSDNPDQDIVVTDDSMEELVKLAQRSVVRERVAAEEAAAAWAGTFGTFGISRRAH